MSTGLANRKQGDVFISNTEHPIQFESVTFYPTEGNYTCPELCQLQLSRLLAKLNNALVFNNTRATTTAFGIAVFNREGNQVAIIRHFNKINRIKTDNHWKNGETIPGYTFGSVAAQKIISNASPQNFLTKLDNLNIADIISSIDNTEIKSIIASIVNKETNIKIKPIEGMSFPAFRDYFCEILQPIALIAGHYTGNANEAIKLFLETDNIQNATIGFNTSKTQGLHDSTISTNNKTLKISSKSTKSGGANASVKNILEQYNILLDKGLINENIEIATILETIAKLGYINAPLELGIKFGIIDSIDASRIRLGISDGHFVQTSNLRKLIDNKPVKQASKAIPVYHALTAIAYKVAEYINNNTAFNTFAASVLNKCAVVQMYTVAICNSDHWVLKEFNTIWPQELINKITLDATKNYTSTKIRGGYSFLIG